MHRFKSLDEVWLSRARAGIELLGNVLFVAIIPAGLYAVTRYVVAEFAAPTDTAVLHIVMRTLSLVVPPVMAAMLAWGAWRFMSPLPGNDPLVPARGTRRLTSAGFVLSGVLSLLWWWDESQWPVSVALFSVFSATLMITIWHAVRLTGYLAAFEERERTRNTGLLILLGVVVALFAVAYSYFGPDRVNLSDYVQRALAPSMAGLTLLGAVALTPLRDLLTGRNPGGGTSTNGNTSATATEASDDWRKEESEEAATVSGDQEVHCRACRYDLRNLNRSGNCPECGTPVEHTVGGDFFALGSPQWLRTVCDGAGLLRWASLVAFGLACLHLLADFFAPDSGFGRDLAEIGIQAGGLIACLLGVPAFLIGGWWFTAPDPRLEGMEGALASRRCVRASLMLCSVIAVVSVLASRGRFVGVGMTLVLTLAICSLAAYIRCLAKYASEKAYEKWEGHLLLGNALGVGIFAVLLTAMGFSFAFKTTDSFDGFSHYLLLIAVRQLYITLGKMLKHLGMGPELPFTTPDPPIQSKPRTKVDSSARSG